MEVTNRPLNDSEYDRMAVVLDGFHSERAMNLEMLDGFFVALICSPDMVPPSKYLPEIWGGDVADSQALSGREELQTFLDLVTRHWNAVVHKLNSAEAFLPLLLEDEEGIVHGNDWALGFMRGMELCRDDWADLLNDENRGGALVAILAGFGQFSEEIGNFNPTPPSPQSSLLLLEFRRPALTSTALTQGSTHGVAGLSHQTVAGQPAKVLVDAQQGERPAAR